MMMRESAEGRSLVAKVIGIALGEEGETEYITVKRSGKASIKKPNPRVVAYHGATRAGEDAVSVSWCSSWVCWVLAQAGVPSPRSKSAIHFEGWGEDALCGNDPQDANYEVGQVIVLGRNAKGLPNARHVGFVLGHDRELVLIVSGNDGDAVRKSWRLKSDVTALRRIPIQGNV